MAVKLLINSLKLGGLVSQITKIRSIFEKEGKEAPLLIGISLSGGGARGFVHLGILKALEELRLKPDIITGTSSGSIVAALYAAGHSPDFILQAMKSIRLRGVLIPSMGNRGLFDIEKATAFLKNHLPQTFEELNIPILVNTCDIINGRSVYYSSGPLLKPLQASCSIPGIFRPIEYEGLTLVDGGLINNMPAEPLREKCRFLIGAHSNYLGPIQAITNMRSVLERTFHLAINQNVDRERHKFDLVIEPTQMKHAKVYDFTKAEQIFEIGYNFTHQLFNSSAATNDLAAHGLVNESGKLDKAG